jgi:hypothetical protein
MDSDWLRRRLERYRDTTAAASSYEPSGYWIGPNGETDAPDVSRNRNDLRSGRLWWKTAHENAVAGIKALDQGNVEMATLYAWQASDLIIAALGKLVRRDEWSRFDRSAKRSDGAPRTKPRPDPDAPRRPRGRPKKKRDEPKIEK